MFSYAVIFLFNHKCSQIQFQINKAHLKKMGRLKVFRIFTTGQSSPSLTAKAAMLHFSYVTNDLTVIQHFYRNYWVIFYPTCRFGSKNVLKHSFYLCLIKGETLRKWTLMSHFINDKLFGS